MKTRMFILAALAAPLLAWGAPISDIGDLIANPDDVMLRKPAKKAAAPKPAIDPALEAAAKADVDRRFAEAKPAGCVFEYVYLARTEEAVWAFSSFS